MWKDEQVLTLSSTTWLYLNGRPARRFFNSRRFMTQIAISVAKARRCGDFGLPKRSFCLPSCCFVVKLWGIHRRRLMSGGKQYLTCGNDISVFVRSMFDVSRCAKWRVSISGPEPRLFAPAALIARHCVAFVVNNGKRSKGYGVVSTSLLLSIRELWTSLDCSSNGLWEKDSAFNVI